MRKNRRIKIPTSQSLEGTALFYLSRYAASEFSLRRVLENRIRRASMKHPEFAGDDAAQKLLRETIATIIARHKNSGALNDNAYADMKVTSLRRAGRSRRAIAQKLVQKGISRDTIEKSWQQNVEDEKDDGEDADFKAALILAKRKKLGPYRIAPADFERKRKDMATLARAGFSLGIARKIIGLDCDEVDDL